RQALLQGDTRLAKKLLGYNYFFEGTVVKGNQLGRTLGYPTANLQLTDNEKLIPGNGVYAVLVRITENDTNGADQPNSDAHQPNSGAHHLNTATAQASTADQPNTADQSNRGYSSEKTDSNGDGYLKGMMNIGVRPTVDGLSRVIEVNLFDFARDIYGATLQVTLIDWLRAEQKFAGLEALKAQLAQDKIASQKILEGPAIP
ncbi:MAG TPA: riboflavin kinase, partial [Flavihumibacter sp.]